MIEILRLAERYRPDNGRVFGSVALKGEQTQIEGGRLAGEEGGGDFADDGGEFEAVARTGTGNDHLPMARMVIKDEVFVGRVGVKADDR